MINPYLKLFFSPKKQKELEEFDITSFYKFDADYFSRFLNSKSPEYFEKKGEEMALGLFYNMAERVPAYKDFLKKHKVNPQKIKTIEDFKKRVPLIDKDNYLRKYPLEKLVWDGKIAENNVVSVSSGSSGVPFYWPREHSVDLEYTLVSEMFMKDVFQADKKSTLFINTFSMGIYIAGLIVTNAVIRVAEKGYPVTVISPGLAKGEVLRIVSEIGDKFDQVILTGYPPFVKDILDEGKKNKVDWKKYNMKFLFATENFSEKFRQHVLKKAGVNLKDDDFFNRSLNIYGSAEAAALGHETSLSILARQKLNKKKSFADDMFNKSDFLPTFAQYNPLVKYVESVDDEVVISSYAGIPLTRYNFHDHGGAKKFSEVVDELSPEELERIDKKTIWNLPFIYVFGKSDKTVSLYGLKIYPENIKYSLEDLFIDKFLTGKFEMEAKHKKNQDQYLEINVELKEGTFPDSEDKNEITRIVVRNLRRQNLEYGCLYQSIKKKAEPKIVFWKKDHPRYFDPKSIKQTWVKKS